MKYLLPTLSVLFVVVFSAYSNAQEIIESHGLSRFGELKYAKGFEHFDYANPEAPKGGKVTLSGFGTFDTLNPYTLKGTSPFNTPGMFMYGITELNETLMVGAGSYSPSGDEPDSAYGLIAERVRYPADLSWIEFVIHPKAAFHDNHPIGAEDVVFSYQLLTEKGHPSYQQQWRRVDRVEAVSENIARVVFKPGAEISDLLSIGSLPVLPKHFWEDKDFERSSNLIPLLSGPYRIGQVELGKSVTLEREASFWGRDLGIYRGRFNFDQVTIDFFRDQTVAFEAFKAGNLDAYYDYTAKNWASAYDFKAISSGDVIKEEIAHEIPSGTQGFFFNTRREQFTDARVRKAIGLLFDFEWTNQSLFNNAYTRSETIFPNSMYQAKGLPSEAEVALLEPFSKSLPEELFKQPITLSKTKGNGQIRNQLREALGLLKSAGWKITNGKLTQVATGKTLNFEILIRQQGIQRILLPFIKNLERAGITATPRLVDAAQYKSRLDQFDFDMTTFVLSQGLSPSYEQLDYFHSESAEQEGQKNYAGIQLAVVDQLLEHVVKAQSQDELTTVMKALDRVLMWNHFIVPNWHLDYHRIAYWNRFSRPDIQAPFKLGFENWWIIEN